MLRHATRIWKSAFYIIGIPIFIFCFFSPALANEEIARSPWSFLEQHRAQILLLSSDEEALAFFLTLHKAPAKSVRTKSNSPSSPINPDVSEEIKKAIITHLASLAVTAQAQAIRQSMLGPVTAISESSKATPEEAHFQWILKQSPFHALKPTRDYYNLVSTWSKIEPQTLPPGNDYANYASFYDQTYPDWDERSESWTDIFRQHGEKGLEARLLEFWQTPHQPAIQQPIPQATQQVYSQQYIGTRLLPIFRAKLLTQTIILETSASETAWETWHHIQQWHQQELTESATTRLCGTWRWIVHNHQNHGDRKMTVTFSPPDQSSPSQIAPTTIAIHGDTVYLKWTFPQGMQEDSLLLSNNDTYLEGTFKNSLGPYGSISGKRLSTCPS